MAEHVENLEEVTTFEKNLAPGLATTLKQVSQTTVGRRGLVVGCTTVCFKATIGPCCQATNVVFPPPYIQVEGRTSDLTNLSHAAKLGEECDLYKRSIPLLMSSMRAFGHLRQTAPQSAGEAQENRNYIMAMLDTSMEEIIRVLQLTSPSEEMGALGKDHGC